MTSKTKLQILNEEIVSCRACDRLTAYREEVARVKRRAYRGETYWGRPVPGFGDRYAWLVIVGLAPAAHGANRTGRMFTGDSSGDFLYAALHRAGYANQPWSEYRRDGLQLKGVYITAPCRCAPPDNKPTPGELQQCSAFLDREIRLLPNAYVYLALGAIGFRAILDLFARAGSGVPSPRPKFAHGLHLKLEQGPHVVASYHVSQQNTNTGRLTPQMFDQALAKALAVRFTLRGS